MRLARLPLVAALLLVTACPKKSEPPAPGETSTSAKIVGLVTDVGGRGDQSFNDSALRGLELWAAGKRYQGGRYEKASTEALAESIPSSLASRKIQPLDVRPVVLQSKTQIDYEPNLQLLVDEGAALTIGVGFMLENAVEAIARRNPKARFLLIDSPVLDSKGQSVTLPNVRTISFREEEGSFLVGALAGKVTKSGKIGFVGGMEIPLIKKFEAGFRAGVKATNPKAADDVRVAYTGSFDNVTAGKQVAQDLLAKGADVLFHAAGTDGLGVIQAVKEARAQGREVYVIGVDSDQSHVAPEAVLTSMVKRVDLAVYDAVSALQAGTWNAGHTVLGLKEGGVGAAEVTIDFPGKAEALKEVAALEQKIASGALRVPTTPEELASFQVSP